MRLFLTTYNKTGTHQIMPALGIAQDVLDQTGNCFSVMPEYTSVRSTISQQEVEKTCWDLQHFRRTAFGHVSYLPEFADALQKPPSKVIFNVRDPRDVICAELHNMKRKPKELGWLNFWLEDKQTYVIDDDPISHLIDFAVRWEKWLGWLEHDFVFKVKYEDLRLNGFETCKRMAEWLEPFKIDPHYVANNLSPRGRNPTFVTGNVGDWKTEFTDEHKKKAREVLGHITERLGYEV